MKLYAWDEFLAMGERKPAEPVPPKADDIATIMYTSGTTGAPEPERTRVRALQLSSYYTPLTVTKLTNCGHIVHLWHLRCAKARALIV